VVARDRTIRDHDIRLSRSRPVDDRKRLRRPQRRRRKFVNMPVARFPIAEVIFELKQELVLPDIPDGDEYSIVRQELPLSCSC